MNFSFINKIIFLDSNIEIFMLFYIEIKKKNYCKIVLFYTKIIFKKQNKNVVIVQIFVIFLIKICKYLFYLCIE